MRVDANVSVRRPGEPLGTRCEIKNLNSVRSLGRAIEYEARRQIALLADGEAVRQETRHWNENDGRTHTLRTKEDADDYRYFPEPDLVPLVPDDGVDRGDPPLACRRCPPSAGRRWPRQRAWSRRTRRWPSRSSGDGTGWRCAAIEAGGDPPRVLVHVEHNLPPDGPDPGDAGRAGGADPPGGERHAHRHPGQAGAGRPGGAGRRRRPGRASPRRAGFQAMDTGALDAAVDEAIAAQAGAWAKYCAGEDKAAGALVGAVMKATKGQADGKAVTALLAGPPRGTAAG